ncbi:MAG: hypothetical protein SPG06_06305 [Eubacteriales bacterium]|nr:hypothetical protein [Eubacteriales bacterium]
MEDLSAPPGETFNNLKSGLLSVSGSKRYNLALLFSKAILL